MQNLAAQVTSSLLQFPETTIEALREDEINLESVLRAKFTTGRAGLAWLACGPQLEVTNSVTSERLSAYCFSTVTERPPTVVAVKEFSWQKKTGLLVGLVEAEGSILCLYDIGISKVVKAVVLPGSVTAIEPLISDGGASASTQHLHQSLRWFFGVAAVVTDVGHVLLIDLCLDDISSNQDELEASDLEVISGIPAEIPKLREAANRERRHLCLQLLAPSGTTVTTVNYISRTNQLAVGFSDGYLSLWNMKTLRREYHVQVEGGRVPVYSVTFQEPENDPRNCCYLWVVQTSQSGRDLSFYLLQLAFGDRKCLPSGQIMYENFEYCEERYNLDLSANALFLRGQTNSMRLLGCQTIEKFRSHSEREDGLHDVSSPDTSVSIFSWQVNTYGQNKPSVYMGVFDINRWYQAQMPDSLRPGQFLRNCSYFAFWSLEALTNMTEDAIFDILVHERSLSRGVPPSYPPPEQFFFPSTYNFDATCLLNSGVIHFTCTGFQKETLHYLKNSGSSLNEEIPDGYNRCLVAGLLSPRLADVQPSSLTQEEQLQAVLSAAVETSSISLLTRCIKQWIEEEQPRSAPNLRFVLEWTWNKVALTKKEFDKLCAPLFDGSCNFVDSQTLQSLQHCHLRLGNLTSVLNCFRKEAKELTKQGLIDLTNKLSVTTLLTQYASVVLWFCRCGLLPDNPDEAMQLTRPYYNYQLMQHYYAERRKKLEHLSRGKWNASTLMIDNMICQLGERVEHLWKRDEGGTGKYPPPTLHALLDLYLLEDADEIKKHAITVYFLLDVMYSFPDKPDSSIESFPTAFTVPCGLIKLIQGFWLLDHNDYQNSVDCILHPAASRVMTWQHNLIIETLMCQGDHRQALRYIQVIKPPISNSTEVKLHMTVFLANRHIFEAWNLQKLHSSRLNVEELLKHMYESCQEMGLMEDLLKLTFTDSEQDYLHKFLHTNGGVQNQELLLVHHLQRANYIPALQLNQSLKNYHLNDSDRRQRERAVARKSILDQYGKILPSVQQTLASDRTRPYPSIIWKKVARPKPLSTITKQAPTGSVITEANFIRNVLMKIKEVSVASENKDFSPYKSFIEESPSPVPQVTELEMPDAFVGTPISKTRRDSRLLGSLVHPILAESSFGVDFENFSCKTPTKSSVLLTSSPVQLNLLKSTQLKNLSKASEFNLLETPLVVKKAKALVASSASSGFMARTPQSILRSSAHTTPLASPSVSPGRSVTPPLRSKETKISFMEQISKKYTKGVLTEHEEPTVSPVLKSGQETMWADRVAMLTQNDAATDNEEMDESSSGIQDGSPSKMEVNKDASNVSARSDQTTLEYHDAPTPEDLEDEVVTKINFSQSTHVHTDIDTVVVPEDVKPPAEFLETEERDVLNTEGLFAHECEPKVLHKLPQVPEPDPQVDSFSDPLEDNPQPTEPQSDSSSRSSVSVISLHDSEDIESAHSEPLDQERRVDNEADLLIMEQNVLIVEEIPAVPAPPSHFVEIQDLNDKVTVEDPEPEVTYQQIGSFGNLDMESNVVREYCNNYEAADEKDSVDARTDVEDEHSLVPNNFSLVLEGDAGDDYAEVESLKADHPIYETLKESSKDSCSSNDENINLVDKVSKEDSCVNALTLSGTEQETKIAESLPYMPEPIKVAIAENLLDVLKETRSKDFTSELKSDLVYENEPVRKLRNIHTTSRSPVKKIKQTNREDLNTNTVKRITPPEKSEEQKLDLDDLETSPSEVKSTLIKPPTPRRSIRKTTKVPESTSDSELPMTPKRRGRKAKENSENVDTTLATLQEEQHSIITRISRRAKGSVSDEPQFTETETVVQETVPKLPSSPARTRRGKASTLDDQINVGDNVDQKIDIPMTPTRITRSSKVVQESENVQSVQHVETEPLVTTPIRGRRGKRMVNELVKQFELGASQASTKSNSSPPVSPKKVSLRWSRVRSENQIEQKSADEDNVTEQEPVADTPKKTVKKSVRKVDVEDSTDLAEEQQRTTRLTRTRSNNVLKPDTTTVEFVFATPTPRRRKNAKAEQTAPPISPKEMPAPVSSEYVFSPPSLRTRRFTRTTLSTIVDLKEKDVTVEESQDTIALVSEVEPAVVPEPEVKPRRGRPPKHRVKKNQPEDKAAWSPPPVKIQLLSPPESPDGDTESTKPLSLETKAAERNQSRKTRRRIVTSKPVTRRKIR